MTPPLVTGTVTSKVSMSSAPLTDCEVPLLSVTPPGPRSVQSTPLPF